MTERREPTVTEAEMRNLVELIEAISGADPNRPAERVIEMMRDAYEDIFAEGGYRDQLSVMEGERDYWEEVALSRLTLTMDTTPLTGHAEYAPGGVIEATREPEPDWVRRWRETREDSDARNPYGFRPRWASYDGTYAHYTLSEDGDIYQNAQTVPIETEEPT